MQKVYYQIDAFFDFKVSNFSKNSFFVNGFADSILLFSSPSLIGNGETICFSLECDMIKIVLLC